MEMNMMVERKDMNFSHIADKMMMMRMYEVVFRFSEQVVVERINFNFDSVNNSDG